jgi:Transcription factor WhiB
MGGRPPVAGRKAEKEERPWQRRDISGGSPPPATPQIPICSSPVSSTGRSLDQVTQAKRICAGCPVQPECLAFALRTHQSHGIWGGLSEQERNLIGTVMDGGPARSVPQTA